MIKPQIHPTPYPEVNVVLNQLLPGIQSILGDNLVGVYLDGSLVYGGFDEASDIDFTVVTDEEITGESFKRLKALHEQIAVTGYWGTQLEGAYVSRHAVRRHDTVCLMHPWLARSEHLQMMEYDEAWTLHRYTLRERGITLVGPQPHTLIDPITSNDLRQLMMVLIPRALTPVVNDPMRMNNNHRRSFTVFSSCRMLYTLETGAVASKPAAAAWVLETLGEKWAGLIEGARKARSGPEAEAYDPHVDLVIDFIRYVLDHTRQFGEGRCLP